MSDVSTRQLGHENLIDRILTDYESLVSLNNQLLDKLSYWFGDDVKTDEGWIKVINMHRLANESGDPVGVTMTTLFLFDNIPGGYDILAMQCPDKALLDEFRPFLIKTIQTLHASSFRVSNVDSLFVDAIKQISLVWNTKNIVQMRQFSIAEPAKQENIKRLKPRVSNTVKNRPGYFPY